MQAAESEAVAKEYAFGRAKRWGSLRRFLSGDEVARGCLFLKQKMIARTREVFALSNALDADLKQRKFLGHRW